MGVLHVHVARSVVHTVRRREPVPFGFRPEERHLVFEGREARFLWLGSDVCGIRRNGVARSVRHTIGVGAIERAGEFRGLYHVLGGRLSPLDGVGPEDLTIDRLVDRVSQGGVREVIIATNPSLEGEATALYVQRQLAPYRLAVTRIASGLPVGGDLEYADGVTIAQALSARREMV